MTPGTPQPMGPQGPVTTTIQCMMNACQKPFDVLLPTPQVFNSAEVSALIFTHERLRMCPHCKTSYLFVLKGIDGDGRLILVFHPVQITPKSNLITTATEQQMQQEAKSVDLADALTKKLKTQ